MRVRQEVEPTSLSEPDRENLEFLNHPEIPSLQAKQKQMEGGRAALILAS